VNKAQTHNNMVQPLFNFSIFSDGALVVVIIPKGFSIHGHKLLENSQKSRKSGELFFGVFYQIWRKFQESVKEYFFIQLV
jgi:hypothetical protein